ncbi:MAG: hypothetical protein ACI81L_002555 [Verrucomicrobiales bacterium]|jgi:hypothetical protein
MLVLNRPAPSNIPFMADRYDSLQPSYLIASIASMPRRWKDALRVAPPKNIDDYFSVAGDDGTTAAEHVGATIAQLDLLSSAIRTTSYSIPEPLGSEVAAAVANNGSGPWPATAAEGLAALTSQFEALHEQLTKVSMSDWNKSADSGRTTLTVVALAQGASRVAADRLAVVERTIRTLSD